MTRRNRRSPDPEGRTSIASTAAVGTWPAQAATVPAARRLVRAHLREHGLDALVADAELLISELVSNVVLHVGGDVGVVAVAADDQVVIEVTDGSPAPPLLRVFSPTSSTGRGMRLVHSLAAEHGVRAVGEGKTVWVRLRTSGAKRSDDDLAGSFADVDWLADLVEPEAGPGSSAAGEVAPVGSATASPAPVQPAA